MAGLALYACANIVNQTCFMLLDEADAFLDLDNTTKFFYFLERYAAQQTQIIIITHKKNVFERLHSLVSFVT